MGVLFSKVWQAFFSYDEFKVIIVGLNNAGKTTTLYKLLLNEVVATAPTIGSNVEEIVYKNIKFVMWDIGGQEAVRSSWTTYYVNTHAVILVVDSTDRKNVKIVKEELEKMLRHESLRTAKILVFANKQDLKGAMTSAELSDALNLHAVKDHDWHIQACCALTGEGLFAGMDWLAQQIKG
ncbi:Arl5family small GTPase [Acanthamoeba castellanii str. Neff]|uniref:Arl5family small GTPase n=1 Tax=Acanthamoeba castellanii (strain ATCC 30010 / Neff) TaxID=1257118 RepID=L8HIM0_ACACF|nr:Arl5family small GTPase [Acanthamoeba castellanii str. Neff]ELR25449.1 Arl5family small GTPase [Acanthamoeba castellanii str. Neff]